MKLLKTSFLLAAASPIIAVAQMTDLGTLTGFSNSDAQAISADGSVIVGSAHSFGASSKLFRWTAASGMVDLGTLGGSWAWARNISADGSVIGGSSQVTGDTGDHAFRWTAASGMVDLGTLGGNWSNVQAMSADGSVIAGQSNLSNGGSSHAFRWTAASGMVDLGTLGGSWAYVQAMSADGSVIGGSSRITGDSAEHAFRWTAASGMVDLGTLGGSWAWARNISADGSVIAGSSRITGDSADHAFRWTAASGMVDLGTLGGNISNVQAMSADGSVLVGSSNLANNAWRAFRWTAASGMVDLGTLGGSNVNVMALSADGSVIVGMASLPSNQMHAFRWTSAGMDDLGTLGGATSHAWGVSADGSVVIGSSSLANGDMHAFMWRGGSMLDMNVWTDSIAANQRIYAAGVTLAGLPLEGAHHRPMLSFDRMGKTSQAWATGDFGSSSRAHDVHVTSGEAGVNWNVGKTGLIGFAAGHAEQNAELAFDGSGTTKGDFALVEYDFRPEGTQWVVSLLGMIGSWESKTNRGYATGSGNDLSFGTTDLITRTARLRVDAPSLVTFGGFGFAPYASYSVTQTNVDAYAETGGAFPASFDAQEHNSTEARVGVTASKDLSAATKLLLTVEAIHRFDGAGPALTGQEIGGGVAFSLPGVAPRADCVRFGFDVDHKLNENTLLNVSAHVATLGEAHDVSAAISIRRAF